MASSRSTCTAAPAWLTVDLRLGRTLTQKSIGINQIFDAS
jgi:hypothetical protein